MSEDKVICDICNIEMLADKFVVHAIHMHQDEVLELISDDSIIKGLSTWVTS